jgi:hypothetical protein
LIIKICSHHFNDKSKEENKYKEDGKEWNEIEEHTGHHLYQESEVVDNSDILHDFDDRLSHANDRYDIVQDVFAHIFLNILLTIVEQNDVEDENEWHGKVVHIPSHDVFAELRDTFLLDFCDF